MTDIAPMTIINYLDTLIVKAMKEGNKDMLSIYRLAKSEMIKYQKDKGVEETLIDKDSVFKTMKKRLNEEIEGFKTAGRDTSIQEKQLAWIESELPKPVSEESIRLDLQSWLPDQPEHCKNIGFVMQHIKLVNSGRLIDMQMASRIAKEMLSNKNV